METLELLELAVLFTQHDSNLHSCHFEGRQIARKLTSIFLFQRITKGRGENPVFSSTTPPRKLTAEKDRQKCEKNYAIISMPIWKH